MIGDHLILNLLPSNFWAMKTQANIHMAAYFLVAVEIVFASSPRWNKSCCWRHRPAGRLHWTFDELKLFLLVQWLDWDFLCNSYSVTKMPLWLLQKRSTGMVSGSIGPEALFLAKAGGFLAHAFVTTIVVVKDSWSFLHIGETSSGAKGEEATNVYALPWGLF